LNKFIDCPTVPQVVNSNINEAGRYPKEYQEEIL